MYVKNVFALLTASMWTTNSTKLPLIIDALLTVIAMVSEPAQPLDSARARLDFLWSNLALTVPLKKVFSRPLPTYLLLFISLSL